MSIVLTDEPGEETDDPTTFDNDDDDDDDDSDSEDLEDQLRESRILQLVQSMKDRILVPMFGPNGENYWTEDISGKFQAFLTKPELRELYVYVKEKEGDPRNITLDVRNFLKKEISGKVDFYYFVKLSSEEITRENFCREIAFGRIKSDDGNPLKSVLDLLEGFWTSVLSDSPAIPTYVEREISIATPQLIAYLKGWAHYEEKKATLLAPLDPKAAASPQPEMIEGVLQIWLRQVRSALALCESFATPSKGSMAPGFFDEIKKWDALGSNLDSISTQIKGPEVQQVLAIAKGFKSPFITQFEKLATRVEYERERAASNLRHLEPLKSLCGMGTEEDKAPDLAAVVKSYPLIANQVLTIWRTSPYYKTKESILGLISLLTNDTLKACAAPVNVDKLFFGHSMISAAALDRAIEGCQEWIKCFNEGHDNTPSVSQQLGWTLSSIFAPLGAFIARCQELRTICDSMKQLGRMKTGRAGILAEFPGRVGPSLRQNVLDLEKSFSVALRALEKTKGKALAVQASGPWQNSYTKFCQDIHVIEKQFKLLMKEASSSYTRIDDTLYGLDLFYEVGSRKALTSTFSQCVAQVWTRFGNIIETIEAAYYALPSGVPLDHPHFAGQAWFANSLKEQLANQRAQIENVPWVMEAYGKPKLMERADSLARILDEGITRLFKDWVASLDDKEGPLPSRLERPLLVPTVNTSQLMAPGISVNFDWELLNIFKEASYWERMGFDLPRHCWEVYRKRDDIRWLREELIMLTRNYNEAVTQLSNAERLMFSHHLGQVDRRIAPALKSYNWQMNSAEASIFLEKAHESVTKAQEAIDEYITASLNIKDMTAQLERIVLVDFPRTDSESWEPMLVTTWLSHYETARSDRTKEVSSVVKDITSLLKDLRKSFDMSVPQVSMAWAQYLKRVDHEIEAGLRKSLKSSLSALRTFLTKGTGYSVGATSGESIVVVEVAFNAEHERTDIFPDPCQLVEAIGGTFPYLVKAIGVIPRVSASANVSGSATPPATNPLAGVLSADQALLSLHSDIMTSLSLLEDEMKDGIKKWTEPFLHLFACHRWKKFVLDYLGASPNMQAMTSDVARYRKLWKELDETAPFVSVPPFLVMDMSPTKAALMGICDEVRVGLCDQIHGLAMERVDIAKAIDRHQSATVPATGGDSGGASSAIDVTDYVLSVVKMINLLENQAYPVEEQLLRDASMLSQKYLATGSVAV